MSLEEKQDLEAFLNMLKINFQWSMVDSITGEPLYSRKPFLKLGMMDDDGGSLSSSPTENLSSPLRHSNKLDSPASSNSTNVSLVWVVIQELQVVNLIMVMISAMVEIDPNPDLHPSVYSNNSVYNTRNVNYN